MPKVQYHKSSKQNFLHGFYFKANRDGVVHQDNLKFIRVVPQVWAFDPQFYPGQIMPVFAENAL